jgi:hypothetical protein
MEDGGLKFPPTHAEPIERTTPVDTTERIPYRCYTDGRTDQALADSRAAVHDLTSQNEALKEENQQLRESAKAFGELAERQADQLRQQSAIR